MDTKLKSIECDPQCGFMVRSHDEHEVIHVARGHAKEKHGKNATEMEMKSMMKTM